MKNALTILTCCMALTWAVSADESPSTVADAVTLASRVADLERRVSELESAAQPKPAETVAAKPILEVHSEEWCGPCQVFERELAERGEVPIEIKPVKFSSRVPAFRWTDASGKQVVRTGYTRGQLQGLIDEVLRANVAPSP
jgi:hypothetical protein